MRTVVRAAHLALTFLTTFPLPHTGPVHDGEFRRASGFYPLAGYAVGATVALVLWATQGLPDGVSAALALTAWLAVTGMLHFDGLVDAADATLAMKSPARRVEILSDVHIGAFGLAAGVLALLLKWNLLTHLTNPWHVIAAAVTARLVLLAPMNAFPAARPESLGAKSREGWWPVALLVAAPILLVPHAWITLPAALLAALAVAAFAASRLGGGIGGDVYGAIVETTEIIVLIVFVSVAHA